MAFIGVLSSWLMFARKALLAWLASSACCLAVNNSSFVFTSCAVRSWTRDSRPMLRVLISFSPVRMDWRMVLKAFTTWSSSSGARYALHRPIQLQGRVQVVHIQPQGIVRHGAEVAGQQAREQQHEEDRGEEGHHELAEQNGEALGPQPLEDPVEAGHDLQLAHGTVAVAEVELLGQEILDVAVCPGDVAFPGLGIDFQVGDIRQLQDSLELRIQLIRVIVPQAGLEAPQEAHPDLLHAGLEGRDLAPVVHIRLDRGRQDNQRHAEEEDIEDQSVDKPRVPGPEGAAEGETGVWSWQGVHGGEGWVVQRGGCLGSHPSAVDSPGFISAEMRKSDAEGPLSLEDTALPGLDPVAGGKAFVQARKG